MRSAQASSHHWASENLTADFRGCSRIIFSYFRIRMNCLVINSGRLTFLNNPRDPRKSAVSFFVASQRPVGQITSSPVRFDGPMVRWRDDPIPQQPAAPRRLPT